jgi:anti-anti-sigma regulatory factor
VLTDDAPTVVVKHRHFWVLELGDLGEEADGSALALDGDAFYWSVDRSADESRLIWSGHLIGETEVAFRGSLARLVSGHEGPQGALVLDMSGVDAIDTGGLGQLMHALLLCEQRVAAWRLIPSEPVRRFLRLVGMGRMRSDQSGAWLSGGGYGDD